MSSFELPDEMAIVAMSLAEREAFLRVLDRERRLAEARVAMFVHAVASVGGHLDDAHRTPRAWGQSSCNWSHAEAGRLVRAGNTLTLFPSALALAQAGELGVAQLHARGPWSPTRGCKSTSPRVRRSWSVKRRSWTMRTTSRS